MSLATGSALLGLAAVVGAYCLSPTGQISHPALSQHYRGAARFRRLSPANLVPEIDQLRLGAHLFGLLDPTADRELAARVRRLFLEVYREMRGDPGFVQAVSALGMCYRDMVAPATRLHVYEYAPAGVRGQARPALIFLHGSLGNFKGYIWVLHELAERLGVVILAPTYGSGNWYTDRHCRVLHEVLEYCHGMPHIDADQLYLAGLSNGGTGVTRAIADHGGAYKGVIMLSPVLELAVIDSAAFRRRAAALPMLLVHGEADRRIPFDYIQERATFLHASAQRLDLAYYPEEDHFLFFSQRHAVVAELATWLRTAGVSTR
jgi:pimeloyl-ACP methyl ester carboxylesterase